ncbi:hypothetical protein PYW08_009428 [Mythimna loreyi]|uniref:Uncharacterized protein n=1 Tax=Mythimna loreyi TaxID=667449 RepID=A0ACC2Q8Q9_9NEOP|nr:hypothetical protein PYW08_009428 [Mythimna loreyi]
MSGTLPSTRQQYASILFVLWPRVDVSSSGTTMKIHSMCVLVLLALLVRSTHCFQWDIVTRWFVVTAVTSPWTVVGDIFTGSQTNTLKGLGQPVCSCKAGYSGNRCEVNMCYDYCLHNGVCYLNEEDKPTCGCPADYEGERCDVAITRADDCADSSTQKKQIMRDLRSGLRQVLKEELKRILQLFSDKLNEDEASVRV